MDDLQDNFIQRWQVDVNECLGLATSLENMVDGSYVMSGAPELFSATCLARILAPRLEALKEDMDGHSLACDDDERVSKILHSMVGTWCLAQGIQLLLEAYEETDRKAAHGALSDLSRRLREDLKTASDTLGSPWLQERFGLRLAA